MNYSNNQYLEHFLQCLVLSAGASIYFDLPFFDSLLGVFAASLAARYLGFAFGAGSAKATIAETEDYGQAYASDLPDNVVELPHD